MTQITTKMIDSFAKFFERNRDKRILVLYGGRASGKSYATAQYILSLFFTYPDLRILITRKTLPSLKLTAFMLVIDILKQWGLPVSQMLNKTELTITNGSSVIFFKSLDDPEKIKSFEANIIWMEEATDFTLEDFLQLNMRCARPGAIPNQIILTFNPISSTHWIFTTLVDTKRDDVAIHQSSYRGNPFLDEFLKTQLKSLKNIDQNFYRIYTLGLPGELQNIVYQNYQVIEDFEDTSKYCFGLDFGYNDPSAMVLAMFHEKDVFLRECFYERYLEPDALVRRVKEWTQNYPHGTVFCDPSRPELIQMLQKNGIRAMASKRHHVLEGINFVKTHRLYITKESVNLIREIKNYSYRVDKNGKVLEDPVPFEDHAVDAMRYAIVNFTGANWNKYKWVVAR